MTTLTPTDIRFAEAETLTGRRPQAAIHLQLQTLRQQGILVDLNITGTGMFQRTPDWVELGIADFAGDERTGAFTKGSKFLYPELKIRAIKSIESRLRQNLDRYTYDVTGVRPFRWLPYTAYQAWREKHDGIVVEAEALKAELIANRDTYVDEIAAQYSAIAEAAWISLTTGIDPKTNRRKQIYQYVQVYSKARAENLTLDREQFVSYVVTNTVSQVPTVEEIKSKLQFDYTTALVYGEEDLAADQARADAIRDQVRLSREHTQLENQLLAEQVRAEAWQHQQDQREREAKLEAMRQAEYEHHRQQLQETVSPFAEVYRAAISQFVDHAKAILESIQKNGHIRGKVAERGRGLLDLYQLMVIPGMGDERLEACLRELKAQLPASAEARNPAAVAETLRDIIALEAEVAADMQTAPSAFSFLEF